MDEILSVFLNVRVKKHEGSYLPNKPLLLLAALGRCRAGKDRLATFRAYEDALHSVSHEFDNLNAVYPFSRLPADGIWEISLNSELQRNSSGDLLRSELIDKAILGGFPIQIYNALSNNHEIIRMVVAALLKKFIPQEKETAVISAFDLLPTNNNCSDKQIERHNRYYAMSITTSEHGEAKVEDVPVAHQNNGFVSYLNSLHNLSASGANALAESQALSPYFGELYEPFPLIDTLVETLTDGIERVVVLTGHAGDGKSTVALDVLKKLRNLPATAPLRQPLKEREDISVPAGTVTIIKDMSELGAERRQQWLHQAFSEPGSWLIISNTGPLLHSLVDYAKASGLDQDIESEILERLDRPFGDGPLDGHSLDGFKKELIILNLTRLDNVALGAKVLTKLVTHSAWGQCEGCSIEPACPLMLNRKALRDAGPVAEERVRWIYQRLNAYEQRLTLRQIVAQLAFGLTGGMGCAEAQQQVASSTTEGQDQGSAGLGQLLFSEGFFGYRAGKPLPQAERLHAVALVRRATFGAPVGVDFERKLPSEAGIGWAIMPPFLDWLGGHWRQRAVESVGVRWRFALRRMAYLFGRIAPDKEQSAAVFLDAFLQSPSLREFDQWQEAGKLTLSRTDANRLRTSCLRVLLEVFSGFSASQFHSRHDTLYLTLRRPDQAVVQPTQLVIETLPFRDFELGFRRMPVLSFDKGRVELALSLPLLDYIRRRDAGELGNELSPVHQAQLDWFQAELLRVTAETRRDKDEIELLRSGIDGEVHLHRFLLDQDQGILEQI